MLRCWFGLTYDCHAVGRGNDIPWEKDVVSCVGRDEAQNDGRDGSVDGERELACRLLKLS